MNILLTCWGNINVFLFYFHSCLTKLTEMLSLNVFPPRPKQKQKRLENKKH